MATRIDLQRWLIEALSALDGVAHHVRIAEHVWRNHEAELRASGDLFYTWQYDLRWAATKLRDAGKLEGARRGGDGVWRLRGDAR